MPEPGLRPGKPWGSEVLEVGGSIDILAAEREGRELIWESSEGHLASSRGVSDISLGASVAQQLQAQEIAGLNRLGMEGAQ